MIISNHRFLVRMLWLGFAFILFSIFYCIVGLNQNLIPKGQKKIFLIEPHASTQTILNELKTNQLVKFPFLLNWYSNLTGKKPVYSGEYLIVGSANTISIWRQLISGKGLYQRSFMIVPGTSAQQILLSLSQNPFLTDKDILNHPQEIAQVLHLPSSELEGWFLPETYFYTRGMSVLQILGRASDLMKKTLDEEWSHRAPNLPFQNPYQALIAASLVEKEAFFEEDKPKIASVLMNRLRKSMRLQFDPTVIYALGSAYQGSLTKSNLQIHSPYNTYWIAGLPPTPIANPSRKTLRAVLRAPETPFLYFVLSGKDKHHVFSENLDQHQKAVNWARQVEFQGKTSKLSCPVQYLESQWQSNLSISGLSEKRNLAIPLFFCWRSNFGSI